MENNLQAKIKTKEDLGRFKEAMRLIEGATSLENLKDILQNKISYDIETYITKYFDIYQNESNFPDSLKKTILDVNKVINEVKVAEIYLPFYPTYNLVDELIVFIRDLTDQFVVISINVDKTIGAGMMVEVNGKYFDYSIKRYLDNL